MGITEGIGLDLDSQAGIGDDKGLPLSWHFLCLMQL